MIHLYSINEIKKELKEQPKEKLVELCINLAKYKNDNKAYLNYLLFNAHDTEAYVLEVKNEVDNYFTEITQTNLYLVKKSLRKILRVINRHAKYVAMPAKEAELIIYFLHKLKNSGIPYHKNKVLVNLYNTQFKKVNTCISKLHQDLQYDFNKELESLTD